jgi:hypothetical protein
VEAKDGMFLHNCSWVFTPTTAATTIRIDHAGGGWVDTVTLAPDGRSLDGTNNANAKIHGTKQGAFDAALAAALAGSWNWVEGQTLIIAADGTCRVLQAGTEINTCRWEVTDVASRSLRFTHRNGGWVDSVTLSSDGRALDGVNNRNTRLHGEKVR